MVPDTTSLDRETVASLASEYPDHQPLAAVEDEHRELLPETFASGDYGWRDAEWVVQWYFRRFLGAIPNAERRAAEEAYGENDYEDVHAAIGDVTAVERADGTEDTDATEGTYATEGTDADATAAKLDRLADLTGVDSSIASAFLGYIEPDSYIVASRAEWEALRSAGEIDTAYPDPPSADEYERYLTVCRSIAERTDCDLWMVYRALWMIGRDESE